MQLEQQQQQIQGLEAQLRSMAESLHRLHERGSGGPPAYPADESQSRLQHSYFSLSKKVPDQKSLTGWRMMLCEVWHLPRIFAQG